MQYFSEKKKLFSHDLVSFAPDPDPYRQKLYGSGPETLHKRAVSEPNPHPFFYESPDPYQNDIDP